MRKMAYIVKIDNITPIENADAIEVAHVGGWKVVVKKGEYSVDDLAVYCEIDSWIPHEIFPHLSKGKEPREYNGVKGEKLRTIKLRKQVSQGLLLPLSVMGKSNYVRTTIPPSYWKKDGLIVEYDVGSDVSEYLNIQKYEPPIPAQLRGQIKGNFPSFIPKTDQERIQNCYKHITNPDNETIWESVVVEEKLEGSSTTIYYNNGDTGVCSRNLDLKEEGGDSFWKATKDQQIVEKLTEYCERTGRNLAIQGELIGNVQGNIYKLDKNVIRAFDIYDIDEGSYLGYFERSDILTELDILQVPVLLGFDSLLGYTIDELLSLAEDKSALNPKQEREGVVVKSLFDPDSSFKIISNKYLMKQD